MGSWSTKKLPSKKPGQTVKKISAVSPPMMRFFGCVGFAVFGMGTIQIGVRLLGINPDFWSTSNWDVKSTMLFILSIVMAFGGMLAGLGVGASIHIKSDRVDHIINVLWHYLANGTLIWLTLFSLVLTRAFGKEGLRRFVDETGAWRFSIYTIGACFIGSLLIGGVLLIFGFLNQDAKPRLMHCSVLSVPIAMAVSYFLFTALHIESKEWIIMGFIIPTALIPVSAYMVNRDKEQRCQIRDLSGPDGE